MTRSFAKMRILFGKDLKDTFKNGNIMVMAALPIVFTVLYLTLSMDGFPMPREFISLLGVLMNLSLVPVALLSMMIAEEKEKNTLRTLMLSNVNAVEFLSSKCLVVLLMLTAVDLIVFFLSGAAVATLPMFLLVTTLTALCVMFLGAIIGLLCKNQMSTGTLAAPVALLLLIPTIFASMNETVAKIAQFVPTHAMMRLLFQDASMIHPSAENASASAAPWLTLGVWLVCSFLLFLWVYRRKRLDA